MYFLNVFYKSNFRNFTMININFEDTECQKDNDECDKNKETNIDDGLFLKIEIPEVLQKNKQKKDKKVIDITGFVELRKKHIKHFHGMWLRYSNKTSGKLFQGGFLDLIENDQATLRCPASKNISISIDSHTFYIKETNENYIALKRLLNEHSRDIYLKESEIEELKSFKKRILNLLETGKIKILK